MVVASVQFGSTRRARALKKVDQAEAPYTEGRRFPKAIKPLFELHRAKLEP